MKSNFVEIRNKNGELANRKFTKSQQKTILKAIISLIISSIEKCHTLSVETIKTSVLADFSRLHQQYISVLEGSISCSPDIDLEKVKKNCQHFEDIINSFEVKGSINSFWNFALLKLESYGIYVSENDLFEKRPVVTDFNYVHKSEYLGFDDDIQIGIEFDNPFNKEVRNELGLEMTLMLLSINKGELYDEIIPPSLTLIKGAKEDLEFDQFSLIIKHSYLKSYDFKHSSCKFNTDYLIQIGSTKYRAKILEKLNEKNLEIILSDRERLNGYKSSASYISSSSESTILHFCEPPAIDDYLISLEVYKRKTKLLKQDRPILGSNVAVNFDFLIHKATSTYKYLQSRRLDSYSAAEKFIRTNDADLVELGRKILSSTPEIQEEFERIIQLEYRKVNYIKYFNSRNSEYKLLRTNEDGKINELIKSWRISQLTSPIFTKNKSAELLIDKEMAKELWLEYLEIESLVKIYYKNESELFSRLKGFNTVKKNEWYSLRNNQSETLFNKWYDLFVKTLLYNGIQVEAKAINDLINNESEFQESLYSGYSLQGLYGRTKANKPTGILSAIIMKLYFGDSEVDLKRRGEKGFVKLFQADNPLYTEITAYNILAKAQSRYTNSLIVKSI